jgi:cyclic beta-1,2-glucan synthetase
MRAQFSLLNRLAHDAPDGAREFDEGFARDDTFDDGQLERLAAETAAEHGPSAGVGQGWRLLPRFQANRHSLYTTYNALAAAPAEGHEIPPAAESLIKGFHLVEEQLQIIGRRLTWRYYHDLPTVGSGEQAGYPRVYGVALTFVTHASGRLGTETLSRFLSAYQLTAPFTVREMRSFDLTLRVVLIERLRRLASHVADAQAVREGESAEEVMRAGHERQSALRMAVDKVIADILSLATLNWREIFERTCAVDAVLREDPAGVYPSMDFASQDSYRRAVERVAKSTGACEADAARRAVALASRDCGAGAHERGHVGFYLLDGGLDEFEAALNYRPRLAERAIRTLKRHATPLYLLAFANITAVAVAASALFALRSGAGLPAIVGVSLLSLIPASEIASLSLRVIIMSAFRPSPLPRLETALGLPDEAATMVVVPTVFTSPVSVRGALETIEAHYLANHDRNIFFALLGDWKAAPREEMPDDGALLEAALRGIKELNARYDDGTQDRFHLFQRRRRWNQSEGEWIGWEKKRGKLLELNLLLRGATDTSYITSTADSALLKRIRYVLSLDSDTELPRDAARKLVCIILHPLNRPRLDPETRRVTRGYGILQPLVRVRPAKARPHYAPRVLSGYLGLNLFTTPFAATAPNIYQDLFGEGIYSGKALYDVDVFEAALAGRIPENSVLSHDLLEGLYARAATVTNVAIFEDPPLHYVADSRRTHRWTRGDWQLLPWLLPRVRDERGVYKRNVLSVIGRWKIIDNLRRTLINPAALLWLVAAWTILPGAPAPWTLFILGMFAGPYFIYLTRELFLNADRSLPHSSLGIAWAAVKLSAGDALSSTVNMAHQSYLMTDATTRTLYRLFISRKHLLEWPTAARVHQESTLELRPFVRYMWPSSLMALVGLALLAFKGSPALAPAAPLLLAWFVSPLYARWISRRVATQNDELEENVEMNVRLNARYAWDSMNASEGDTDSRGADQVIEGNDSPLGSPLKVGRLLVWTLAAHELGAVCTLELAERLGSTLSALESLTLAREGRGESVSLHTAGAAPQHVLISERGNLAGFIRALKERCNEVPGRPLFDERVVGGVTDTLLLIKIELLSVRSLTLPEEGALVLAELSEEIEICLDFLRAAQKECPKTNAEWGRFIRTIGQRAAIIELLLSWFSEKCPAVEVERLRSWARCLVRQALELRRDERTFVPWTSIRTARLEPIIRRHYAPAVALWEGIVEGLNRPAAISRPPEELKALSADLASLRGQLERLPSTETSEREKALRLCDELRDAVEDALRASSDGQAHFAGLANRSRAVAHTADFRLLFDEEYRFMREQLQFTMAG